MLYREICFVDVDAVDPASFDPIEAPFISWRNKRDSRFFLLRYTCDAFSRWVSKLTNPLSRRFKYDQSHGFVAFTQFMRYC